MTDATRYEQTVQERRLPTMVVAIQSVVAFDANRWRRSTRLGGFDANTQLTINADYHPLMRRFHKPGDEKRALVIVPQNGWDDWLNCSDPEYARSFLQHYPADMMRAWEFPSPPRTKKSLPVTPTPDTQMGPL